MLRPNRISFSTFILVTWMVFLTRFQIGVCWSILPRRSPAAISADPKVPTLEVRSKSRPTVTFDYNSGAVINPPNRNKWRAFKATLYGAADKVGNLASKVRQKKSVYIQEGYKDAIERKVTSTALENDAKTPGERLIQQYREQQKNEVKIVQRERDESVFDSFKEKVYSAVERVTLELPPSQEQPKQEFPSQAQSITTSPRPKIASSPIIKSLLPELQSPNPLKRWNAERQIRKWEKEQRQREIMLEREAQVRALKSTIYTVVDTAAGAVDIMAKTPAKVVETAEAAQRNAIALSGSLQSSVRVISGIPSQVSRTAKDLQGSVESTVESTKQFVEDVAAIPGQVKQSVADTQKAAQQTASSIDEAFTNIQVLASLKEKPPPPPPPPKKLTIKNIALDVAGSVAEGSAQVAWWLGKEAVGLGWRGAKSIFTSVTQSPKKDTAKKAELTLRTSAETIPTPPKEPPSAELLATAEKSARTRELENAVERVKSAAMAATQEALEVEEAVRKAKAAAMAATQDTPEAEE